MCVVSSGDMILLDPDVSYMVELVGRGDPSPKRETEQGGGSLGSWEVQEERTNLGKEAKVEFEKIVKMVTTIISQSPHPGVQFHPST